MCASATKPFTFSWWEYRPQVANKVTLSDKRVIPLIENKTYFSKTKDSHGSGVIDKTISQMPV